MAQALIQINAVTGSNSDLPINVVVALTNVPSGGETTYLWEILTQPEGPADVLATPTAASSSFTPKKEGSYLIRLTVNGTLTNEVVAAVRQIKSALRVPAGNETAQVNATTGWSVDANRNLQSLDKVYSDANVVAGIAASALTVGQFVRATSIYTLKSTLPGEEKLLKWDAATANTAPNCRGVLGVVVSRVPAGAIALNDVVRVRLVGLIENFVVGGSPAVAAEVYLTDAGGLSTLPGTVSRLVGHIVAANGLNWDVFFNGALAQVAGGGGGVPPSRLINTTTPINGGGDLSVDRTLTFAFPGEAWGDVAFRGAAGWQRLAAGTAGHVLSTNGASADPAWIAPSGGISGITINTSAPLAGGTGFGTSFSLSLSYDSTLTLSGSNLSVVYGTTAGTAAQGNDSRIVNAVQNTRQVLTTAPLGGGGALSSDLTLTWSFASEAWGDLVFRGTSAWQRLPAGTAGQFLQSNGAGADPSWATIPAGTGSLLYIWTDFYSGATPLTAGTSTAGGAKFIVAEHGLPGSGQPVYLRVLHRRFSGTSFVRYRLRNSSGNYVANLDGGGNNYIEFTGTTPAIEEKQSVDLTGHTNFSVSVDDIYEVEIETDTGVVAIAERAYLLARVSTAGGSYTLPFFLVGPAGSGPSGSSPAFSTISAALAAAPTSATIVVMDGTYVENPTITKSHRVVSWSSFNGESGGGVVVDGTFVINPDANGRKVAIQGIRCAPTASGQGIYITGANSCDVDLSFSEAYAPGGFAGVEVDNTSANTRVFAQRLRAESVSSRGYYAHGAAHVHRLNNAVITGASVSVEANDGASVTLHSAQEINKKLVANGGIIVVRFGYLQAGAAAPFRIGGNGTLTAECCRVDSTNAGDFVEYTGSGSATYLYSLVSVYGNAKQTYAAGVTPIPATTTQGNLEQTLTATASVNESTDVLFLNHASVKIEATLPDPTNRISRLFYAKNISTAQAQAHDLKAVGGTTINGSASITLAPGVAVMLWAAFGSTDWRILSVYIPSATGVVPFSRVPLSARYGSVPGSTSLEKAGGGVWVSAEHDYSGSRTIKLRVALYSPDNTNNVRVKLWNVTAGAWVADLDGAANDYLQTSSSTPTILTSVDLEGHTNFTAGGTGIYEIWVQSTNSTTTAELLSAEFIVG